MERIAVVMGKMHSGGKKNLIMEYYRHIDRTKIQFDFICDADSNAIPDEEIKSMGGKVYIVTPYQNIVNNMRDIYKICTSNHYKIIHSYNGTMNLFSMFIGWRCGIPIRINESISMAHSNDKKTIIKNILKLFSKMFATHYMANGEECGRWQFGNKLYKQGNVKIFKTVIDTYANRFDLDIRKETREKFDLNNDIVIGHIGRLTEQKNTLFIIDIFNEIVKMEPKAKLLIIGDGNLRESMLKRINEYKITKKVLYLGRREDIKQFYCAMDCFLLPSLYEGLPVVGIEAQNSGLPVFFSTEIPEESNACDDLGYFISLNKTAKEWAEAILIATKKNINKRFDRTAEVKASGFDSELEAKKLLTYYEEILLHITK